MNSLNEILLYSLDHSSSLFCIMDAKGRVSQQNKSFVRVMAGLGVQSTEGTSLPDLISEFDFLHLLHQKLEKSLSGSTFDENLEIISDYHKASFHLVIKPFYQDGILNNVLLLINNWQEHDSQYSKSFRDVWKSWRQNLHKVIEQAPIPMSILADDGSFLFINNTLLSYTGYKREEIKDLESWADLAYGKHKESRLSEIKSLFDANKIVDVGEVDIYGKDKEKQVWHLFSAPLAKTNDGKKLLLNMAVDITSHKEKEDLLEKQRRELAVLTEQLPQLLYTADAAGKVNYVNQNWLNFTGKTLAEVREKMWFHLVHPHEQERVRNKRLNTLATGEVYEDEFRFLRKDGNYRWLFVRNLPIKNISGKVIKWIGTATDIHESKEANQRIEEKANEFYSLAETIDHHVWVSDAKGNPLYLNKTWYQYTGLDNSVIEDRQWFKIFHPDELINLQKIDSDAKRKGEEYHLEVKLRRHDGTYRWFLTHATPVKNAEGDLVKWIGTNTDIHEQKVKAERLQSELSHLKELIESIPQLAWTSDTRGKINYYNKEWYLFTGADEQNFYDWELIDYLIEEDKERYYAISEDKRQKEESFQLQVRFYKEADKNYYWHIIQQRPVKDNNNKIKFWLGTATNIHEQKMLEQQKGAFLNIASHELKTPITSLSGFLQMSREMCENSNPTAANLLKKATASVDNLQKLIEELLDLSRIENGMGFHFEKEPTDFDEFIKDAIAEAESLYNITIDFSGKTNALVAGNKFRLSQVVDNLISNALKYAETKSPIIVHTARKNGSVLLKVQDHGIGIAKEKLNRIFDRFYRVTETGFTSGLGIGLYLCKNFVEKHNGTIWAESEEGKGTTFYVKLPVLK